LKFQHVLAANIHAYKQAKKSNVICLTVVEQGIVKPPIMSKFIWCKNTDNY